MGKNSHNFKRGGHNNRGNFRGNSRGHHRGAHRGKSWGNNFSKPRNSNNDAPRTDRSKNFDRVTLKETQVGITEFITSGKGFTGVVKARFSDFHVNEIGLDGTVAHLNDFSIPEAKDPDCTISSEELDKCKTEISDVVTEDVFKQIDEIAKGIRQEPLEFDVTNLDKDKRTTIHKVIKKLYEVECNSCTVNKENDTKFIKVSRSNRKENNRTKWLFPGEFVHFLVYKENMDSSEVAVIIANGLRMKPSFINYCGTKDKRGKTTQKFCIRKRHPKQIVGAVRSVQSVKVGNFTFHDKVIKLGELKGNRFRIALRHITEDRQEIENVLQSIKELGFINYYGLQRFGNNADIPTYQIGIALLKKDYKTACELILKPRENDVYFMRNIRETWWKNRDSKAAAEMFYNDRFIEKKLLDGLAKYGENDYANALRKIPRNMLLLYTHAYQSLVFNRIASRRIKEHGPKLMVGDLVYRSQDELKELNPQLFEACSELPDDAVDVDDPEIDQEEVEGEEIVDEGGAESKEPEPTDKYKLLVKPLTEEDISSGKYTIFDVVLPLPGHDIQYPANELQQWYEDILAEEDLNSEKLKHGVKTYSLAGAYRKLMVKPENMSWYFKTYSSPQEDIIPSHFEKKETDTARALIEKAIQEEGDGKEKFTALVLDFCLPASVYATMFLREILKTDTSSTNQAALGKSEMKKFEERNSSRKEEEAEKDASEKPEEQEDSKNDESEVMEDQSAIEDEQSLSTENPTAQKRTIEQDDGEVDAKKAKAETE